MLETCDPIVCKLVGALIVILMTRERLRVLPIISDRALTDKLIISPFNGTMTAPQRFCGKEFPA